MTSVDPLVAELRALRLKAGLTQGAVAAAVGTSQRYLCNVEGGRQQPSVPWLRRLGQALGVQPGWLPLAYETAPAVPEIAAGNGATDGPNPSVAPASDPAPLNSVAGSDVALREAAEAYLDDPCTCDAHRYIREQIRDPEFAAAWQRALEREPVARTLDACPCGHSWSRHIFGQLPDSELCCVADCDKTRCPGAAVSLISTPGKPAVEGYSNLHDVPPTLNPDAIRDAYGLGPDPSVALIAFNDALAEDPDFAAAWERALERDPVSRTLDVAEHTAEKAQEAS